MVRLFVFFVAFCDEPPSSRLHWCSRTGWRLQISNQSLQWMAGERLGFKSGIVCPPPLSLSFGVALPDHVGLRLRIQEYFGYDSGTNQEGARKGSLQAVYDFPIRSETYGGKSPLDQIFRIFENRPRGRIR